MNGNWSNRALYTFIFPPPPFSFFFFLTTFAKLFFATENIIPFRRKEGSGKNFFLPLSYSSNNSILSFYNGNNIMNNVIILKRIFSMLIAFFCTSSECNFKDTILRKNLIIFFFPFFFPDADYSTIEYLHGGAYLHRYIIKEYLFTKYVSDRVNILRRDFDKTASGDRTKGGTRKKNIPRKGFTPRDRASTECRVDKGETIATLSSRTLQNYLRSIIPYLIQRRPLTGPTYDFTGRTTYYRLSRL